MKFRLSAHFFAGSDLCSVAMGALLEVAVTSPPGSIALKLTKDINWIRVRAVCVLASLHTCVCGLEAKCFEMYLEN